MTADQAPVERSAVVRLGAAAVEEVGVVLAALADPTRRLLLDVIVDAGRSSATRLADLSAGWDRRLDTLKRAAEATPSD